MKTRKHRMAEINVVPYIDVMLVLLVIFVITAPLLSQGVNVRLPQADAKAIASKEHLPIIVSIDNKGLFYLNIMDNASAPLNEQELVNRVAAELAIAHQNNQNRMVLVKGDEDVPYGRVVGAMVLLQKAGVDQVGLMTQSPSLTERTPP